MARVDGQGRAGPLRRAQQRPPRDGDQLGAVAAASARRSATTRPSAPSCRTSSASAARCRPTSPSRATRRSPGSWARAPSSAAATSRSAPATRTHADFQVQDVAPAETLTPRSAGRRQTLLAGGGRPGPAGAGQRPDRDLRRVPAARRRPGAVAARPAAPSPSTRKAPRLRDRYGRNTFGQSCLLARRLVERGVRFVTVNYGGWDHHAKIWDSLDRKLPEFDQGFSALIEDLDERGLLADTLVLAWASSAGRRAINKDTGRDHWGPAASLLFAGAGVRGGQVLGADRPPGRLRHAPAGRAGRRGLHDLRGGRRRSAPLADAPRRPADRDPRPRRAGARAVRVEQLHHRGTESTRMTNADWSLKKAFPLLVLIGMLAVPARRSAWRAARAAQDKKKGEKKSRAAGHDGHSARGRAGQDHQAHRPRPEAGHGATDIRFSDAKVNGQDPQQGQGSRPGQEPREGRRHAGRRRGHAPPAESLPGGIG